MQDPQRQREVTGGRGEDVAVAVARRAHAPDAEPLGAGLDQDPAVDAVVADLRAGRPARVALVEQGDAVCPRTVAAVRLGGDVVAALDSDAREQSLPLLGQVAACWSVAESSGAGLVAALEQVVAAARADEEIRAEVASQLAAPRAAKYTMGLARLAGCADILLCGKRAIFFRVGCRSAASRYARA